MDKVEKYIDDYIKHIIDFQLYGNKFCKQIQKFKDESVATIFEILRSYKAFSTKIICNKARAEVGKELDLLAERITDHIISQVGYVIAHENTWATTKLSDFLEVDFSVSDDPSKLLSTPIAYAGVVQEFGENVVNKYRSLFFDAIATSYITGMAVKDLDASFNGRLSAINRGLEAEAKTMGSSLGSSYDRIIFTKNTKQIKGYIWSSILDSHTCLVCGELNGKVYHDIRKVPMYPIHYRCRCFLIPFTQEIEEVIPQSYSKWFEEQTEEDKRSILGKTRYQLYKNGMKIGDFVNNGQITPLKSLKIKKDV